MAQPVNHLFTARPFLKWAGGKTQLLKEVTCRLPEELTTGKITRYAEPFIGGGAVFFCLNQQFRFGQCCIFDVNDHLVVSYRVVKRSVRKLVAELAFLESMYLSLNDNGREAMYYEVRDLFNRQVPEIDGNRYRSDWILHAARMIFLNRTCYNGLFRVNRKGEFNVPFGRYRNPVILDEDNLNNAARVLTTTLIQPGDFSLCRKWVDEDTFVYFDPPYRPLDQTPSFTSYAKNGFFDADQVRLAEFFRLCDEKGAKVMLSNSDPKNVNGKDNFFDDLFADYCVERVPARRMINSDGAGRGTVNELIITNYRVKKH